MNKKVRTILDSGAFTAYQKGIVLDVDKYGECVESNKEYFDGFFNMDSILDGKTSYQNWKYLRKNGIHTIPIYHIGTDLKWLERYLRQTDHIGIGAIASLSTSKRLYGLSHVWQKYLTDRNGMPQYKVHGLGLTAIPIMMRYPWYSLDSFTPIIAAVWGGILLPAISSDGDLKYFEMEAYKISAQSNHQAGTMNSFLTIPMRIRSVYMKMIEDAGYTLGEITHKEKIERRGRKGEFDDRQVPLPGVIEITEPDENKNTLANNWVVRMDWNLYIWGLLRERMPEYPRPFVVGKEPKYEEKVNTHNKTIMYIGVSTCTHLHSHIRAPRSLDLLTSYYYLKGRFEKEFKQYIS